MRSSAIRRRLAGVSAIALAVAALFATPASVSAQGKITSPKEYFGHNIGDDYWLPNYAQFMGYWQKIAKESPRAKLDTMGMSAEGRPQLSMIVSSPENIKKLTRLREISKKLAYAEIGEAEAKAFAKEGKAVVWIDGGLHATEVLGANQLIETNYQMLSGTDEETLRILNDVVIVFVHANPDGMELVANWYMQEADPKKRDKALTMLAAIDFNAGGKLMAKDGKPSDADLMMNLTNKPMVLRVRVWDMDGKKGNWVQMVASMTAPAQKAAPAAATTVQDGDVDF